MAEVRGDDLVHPEATCYSRLATKHTELKAGPPKEDKAVGRWLVKRPHWLTGSNSEELLSCPRRLAIAEASSEAGAQKGVEGGGNCDHEAINN